MARTPKAPQTSKGLSLIERMKTNSTVKEADILEASKFFEEEDFVSTPIHALNIALSGDLYGGLRSGLTVIAGPSKHFKSLFTLLMLKAYLDQFPDAIGIFYDSEFGSPKSYFQSLGIDMKRVLHTPVANIEELKFDLMNQLEGLVRGDKVFIAIDSIGNLASKKEVEDAVNQKSVSDMTRAKQIKSLFRMVTPILTIKQLPMVAVNHTYMTQEMFSKAVVSGGCLVSGTNIRMFDGKHKSVDRIVVGDMVDTLNGPKLVTHSWTPETLEFGEPDCFEVEFEDGSTVVCSNHHPFMVDGEWVDAEDLHKGMMATRKS